MARFLLFSVCLLFLIVFSGVSGDKTKWLKRYEADEGVWREFEEFREWKRWNQLEEKKKNLEENFMLLENEKRDGRHLEKQDPPPIDNSVLMARYIVNQANWSSVATISSSKVIQYFPFANVVSVSDGLRGNGSGIIYMYLTPLDFTAKDVAKDNRVTLMMTLAQGPWCKEKSMDPMDPRCARIILSGKIKKISPRDRDYNLAKDAVFGRHPWFTTLPPDHDFFFAKLKMGSIVLLDAFGGAKYISVADYLKAIPAQQYENLDHLSFSEQTVVQV